MIPPGGGPDERDHTDYVRSLAEHGRLPALPGSALADQPGRLPTPQAQHPPLYYLLMAPLYQATGGTEQAFYLAGRLLGVLLGLAGLLLVRAAARMTLPRLPAVSALGLVVAAGFGSYTYVVSTVNNEALAVVVVCAALYVLAWGLRNRRATACAALLGLLLGLALLVKLTASVVIVPLAVAAVALSAQGGLTGRRRALATLRLAGIGLLVAAAVSGWWLVRNAMVYDTPLPRTHVRPILYSLDQALVLPEVTLPWLVAVIEEAIRGLWAPLWLLRRDPGLMVLLIHTDFMVLDALKLFRPMSTLVPAVALLIPLVGLRRAWRQGLLSREHKWLLVAVLVGMAWLIEGLHYQLVFVDAQVGFFIARYLPVMLPGLGMALAAGVVGLVPGRRQWAVGWALLAAVAAVGTHTWWLVAVVQVHTL